MCVTYLALLSLNLPEEDGRERLEKIGHPIRLERERKDATARSFQTTTYDYVVGGLFFSYECMRFLGAIL